MTAAKSRFFILGGLVSVSLAMGMAALVSSRPEEASPLQTVSHQSQKVEVQPVEKALYQYVVRDYQGKIAVYSSMEARQLGISPHQLSYVTHSGEGEGLLFYGSTILPFVDHFPKNTELYRIMTTKPQEMKEADGR